MKIQPHKEQSKPQYPSLLAAAAVGVAVLSSATSACGESTPEQLRVAAPGAVAQQVPSKEGKRITREPRRLGGKRKPRSHDQVPPQPLPGRRAPKPTKPTT